MATTCGVIGDFFGIQFPACQEEPTEVNVFRCERGHIRDRATCAEHAAILLANGALGQTLCRECYDAGDGEVPIVLVPDETATMDDPPGMWEHADYMGGLDEERPAGGQVTS